MLYLIKISKSLSDLTGIGVEYLLDQNGDVIAKFIDGRLSGAEEVVVNTISDEITKIAA